VRLRWQLLLLEAERLQSGMAGFWDWFCELPVMAGSASSVCLLLLAVRLV
jgi:hypothetical protein